MERFYSKDQRRIYYFNRHIKAADYATFEVVQSGPGMVQFARDKNNFFVNDDIVAAEEFSKHLAAANR